jgi:hypothetical protein
MSKPRYITKSRYKLATECPTKLFYTTKKEYNNTKMDDPFLAALAEGGFQVGELAKLYHPGGHDIESLDYETAESQTLELLKQDDVIIFEPAIRFKDFFIRVDVLIKSKNRFKLIEVKAKSFDSNEEEPFLNKNGTVKSTWRPYLHDVAFQKWVLQNAYPDSEIESFLMMADKNAPCPVDGLNQKFKIVRSENRKGCVVSNSLTTKDLEQEILIKVPVDEYIDLVWNRKDSKDHHDMPFEEELYFFAEKYRQDEKIKPVIGSHCRNCEFKCTPENEGELKSGYKECWNEVLGWTEADFQEPNVLDIWNFRKKDALMADEKFKLTDLSEDDIAPKPAKNEGMSASERQWLQVELANQKSNEAFVDIEGLALEMEKWVYPLHFIDFETTAVAIPFNEGRKPYEGVAFQFSHHVVYENGCIEHKGQYLNTNQGEFPNYDFVRALKKELEGDEGTIFRYAPHENSYLNLIYRQIEKDMDQVEDADELCAFIKSITKSVSSSVEKWKGERCMVDLWELVKKFYYHPMTKGSNSIKYVLPAILNSSSFLKEKYNAPIYGSEITSLNFKDWTWIEMDADGSVKDPYKLLPRMFQDVSEKNFSILSEEDELRNGGAALTAYGKMQFSEISEYEKNELCQALLKYCELDTLAMVMIYEHWKWLVDRAVEGEEAA